MYLRMCAKQLDLDNVLWGGCFKTVTNDTEIPCRAHSSKLKMSIF